MRKISIILLIFLLLICFMSYLSPSPRPFAEKVAQNFSFIGRIGLEKILPDAVIAKISDKPVLPRRIVAAIKRSDLVAVTQSLDTGLDINAHDYTIGMTMLHHAASSRNLELVKLLIARGANVNSMDHDHSTPLHFAAYKKGNLEVLNYLIQSGAKIDLVDDEGLTALDYAELVGDNEMAKRLTSNKSN